VTPLYLAKRADMYLPQFKWYDELRPKSPDDIYDVSDELKQLMRSIEGGTRRRSGSNAVAAEAASQPSPDVKNLQRIDVP
jgi:hypothetical protein